MNDPTACDMYIFNNGRPICALDAGSADADKWVNLVAEESGQRVDWHYSGGIAQVLYVGDRDRVELSVHRLRDRLNGTILRIFEDEAPGLYRAGDPIPDGATGVVTTGGVNEWI